MKNTDLLREFITLSLKSLNEAAVNVQQATGNNLALHVQNNAMVLYSPKFYSDFLQEKGVASVAWETGGILGYIKLAPGDDGSCWGAAEVAASAAVKGYGPMMYDIAMSSINAPLMPDRSSLSPKAAQVWDFYDKKRSDVKKLPLDNIDDPKTPDEKDDCKVWDCSQYGGGEGTDCSVNKAYTGANADSSALVNNHKKFVKSIEDGQQFEKELFTAGQSFFDEKVNS
jgi:hypothetical protein